MERVRESSHVIAGIYCERASDLDGLFSP
jgi:hypothetical protein